MLWSIVLTLAFVAVLLIGLGGYIVIRRQTGPRSSKLLAPAVPPIKAAARPSPDDRPAVTGGGYCGLLFGLGWTGFSLIFVIAPIAIFITEWQTYTLLRDTGVPTEAVIISRRIDEDSEGDSYYVTYRYTAPLPQGDRADFTQTESVSRDTYQALPPESRVTVRYSATHPEIARLADRSMAFQVGMTICFMLFGGLFVLIGLWLTYSSGQAVYYAAALARQGVVTTGILADRWTETDSEGDKTYCVAVRFATLDGSNVTIAEYNRKAYHRLLEGDQVAVRYLPKRPEISRLEM